MSFDTKLSNLNLDLYRAIKSELEDDDKQSLLAIQKAVRERFNTYAYLEIGSHLGGSIQPYLLDPACSRIYSIDKRPIVPPDERKNDHKYIGNSTQRMLDLLAEISPDIGKIKTFDSDASEVSKTAINPRPQLCFVDGEHTDKAAVSDFNFCRSVMNQSGVMVFDDANIIYQGLAQIIEQLKSEGVPFRHYALPQKLYVLEFGDFYPHLSSDIQERLINNTSYLFALNSVAQYRTFYNRPVIKFLRDWTRWLRQ